MKNVVALLAALVSVPALAQTPAPEATRTPPARTRLEISTTVGALLPTGDQRDLFRGQYLFGLNASYDLNDYFAVVGSLGVTTDKMLGQSIEKSGNARLDRLYQYDLGVRVQKPFDFGTRLTMRPFLGVGLGARSYTFKSNGPSDETDLAGYGTAGVSFEYRRIVLALAARGYFSSFDGSDPKRTDLAVFETIGLRF